MFQRSIAGQPSDSCRRWVQSGAKQQGVAAIAWRPARREGQGWQTERAWARLRAALTEAAQAQGLTGLPGAVPLASGGMGLASGAGAASSRGSAGAGRWRGVGSHARRHSHDAGMASEANSQRRGAVPRRGARHSACGRPAQTGSASAAAPKNPPRHGARIVFANFRSVATRSPLPYYGNARTGPAGRHMGLTARQSAK